jgi:hypothetical protein
VERGVLSVQSNDNNNSLINLTFALETWVIVNQLISGIVLGYAILKIKQEIASLPDYRANSCIFFAHISCIVIDSLFMIWC